MHLQHCSSKKSLLISIFSASDEINKLIFIKSSSSYGLVDLNIVYITRVIKNELFSMLYDAGLSVTQDINYLVNVV